MPIAGVRALAIEVTLEEAIRAEFGDLLGRQADLRISRTSHDQFEDIVFAVSPHRSTAASLVVECEPNGSDAVVIVGEGARVELMYTADSVAIEEFSRRLRQICRAVRTGSVRETVRRKRGIVVKSVAELNLEGERVVLRTSRLSNPFARSIEIVHDYGAYEAE